MAEDVGIDLSDLSMDQLMGLLRQLQLRDTTITEYPIPEVLQGDVTIESFARAIREGHVTQIITMAGAGISTSCGIPDFRTPGTGLYSQLESYGLDSPQDIFSIDFFKKNPNPFNRLAKEIYPTNFRPSPTHCFLRLLQDKGLLLRHYTQNIDGLESLAGLRDENLVEAHGHFRTAHCVQCNQVYPGDEIKDQIFDDQIPRCGCEGLIKPDIVFFGEALPPRFAQCVHEDFPRADLLLVMGTSLQVAPFNSLVSEVASSVPRMLINFEAVGTLQAVLDPERAYVSGVPMNECFRFEDDGTPMEKNYRDVFMQGPCDDSVRRLVHLLGWSEEFNAIVTELSVSD